MDRAWQEAASFLGLSNEEYARRRVLMTNPVLIKGTNMNLSYRPVYIRAFLLMWVIVDSTQGWFLEYWIFPEKKCVVSLKSEMELEVSGSGLQYPQGR